MIWGMGSCIGSSHDNVIGGSHDNSTGAPRAVVQGLVNIQVTVQAEALLAFRTNVYLKKGEGREKGGRREGIL